MTVLNLASPIFDHALTQPDHPAIRGPLADRRVSLSYAHFAAAIAESAQQFRARGVNAGDRVVLIAPSTPEFVIAFFALQALGSIVVAVNPLSTTREIAFVLKDSGASMLLAHSACAEAGLSAAHTAAIPAHTLPEVTPEHEFHPHPQFQLLSRTADDVAALLYTSGTTGTPKGAMLTVGNLHTVAEVGVAISGASRADRFGTALPLFHIFGLSSVTLVAMRAGATLTLLPRFVAQDLFTTISADQLTVVAGVPTMWNALVHHTTGDCDTSALRLALSGGASIAVETMRAFEDKFAATIAEGYGLTETSAFGTFNPWDGKIIPGSVGQPVPTMDVRVLTSDDQPAPTGTVGEVVMRGPLVMSGYWGREDATQAAFTSDRYFRTGDLGRFDEDGYLYIVDRLKELIIHGGYNVYPREIEEVLYEHPGVLEAAVVGVDDDYYGQNVAAILTPLPGHDFSSTDIQAWCRERLAAYKIPRIVNIVSELPKGPTGKILKRQIQLQ